MMNDAHNCRVGIVEDDKAFRRSFVSFLASRRSVCCVSEWSSAEDFIRDGPKDLDILFIDIKLPGMSGLDLAASLSIINPDLKRVIITTLATTEHIMHALRSGCLGYMLKHEIETADSIIHSLMNGGAIITPTVAFRVMQTFRKVSDVELKLTHREMQILQLVVDGLDVNRVARFLGISIHTVRDHIKNIYRKMNVSNRMEMLKVAKRMGLV